MQRLRDYKSHKFHYSVSLEQSLEIQGQPCLSVQSTTCAGYNKFLYNGNIMLFFSVTLQLFATLLKRVGQSLTIDFSHVQES